MTERRQMQPIRFATYINAPAERVYGALSTGPGWDSWFTTRASIDARAGGKYEFFWQDFGAESGYSFDDEDVVSCLDCACGWGEALTLLKFYLEHGVRYGEVPPAQRDQG